MKRIVFCTELGGNYGHITGFIPLAERLRACGCELFFILRSTQYAYLLGAGAQAIQAPLPKFLPARKEHLSYAGILSMIGYGTPIILSDYLGAWRNKLAAIKPDLVIADHAPTALLAAHSLGLRSAAIGTGFVIPPSESGFFPSFNARTEFQSDSDETTILPVVNKVLSGVGIEPLQYLGQIFSPASRFLCSFPELDHYGVRGDADYWGPLYSDHIGEDYLWPSGAAPKIFAYVTPKITHLHPFLDALAELEGTKLVHIPGGIGEYSQKYTDKGLVISSTPLRMESILPDADLVISQAGAGLSSLCAIYGKRHVMIPTQMEQHMLAQRMASQGLAYAVKKNASQAEFLTALTRAISCPVLSANTKKLASLYVDFDQEEQIAAMVEELLSPLT